MPSTIRGSDNFDSSPVKSMVRVLQPNAYGSTNVNVRRFAVVDVNQGADVAYVDDGSAGASFTVVNSGVYSVTFVGSSTATAAQVGVTKNSASPPSTAGAANVLAVVYTTVANYPATAAWSGYLPAGTVVRAAQDATAAGTFIGSFTITRIA